MADKKTYRDFFNEWWPWFVKNLNPPDVYDKKSDEYWSKLIDEADKLSKKYGNKKFFNRIIVEGLNEIDRIGRGNEE